MERQPAHGFSDEQGSLPPCDRHERFDDLSETTRQRTNWPCKETSQVVELHNWNNSEYDGMSEDKTCWRILQYFEQHVRKSLDAHSILFNGFKLRALMLRLILRTGTGTLSYSGRQSLSLKSKESNDSWPVNPRIWSARESFIMFHW